MFSCPGPSWRCDQFGRSPETGSLELMVRNVSATWDEAFPLVPPNPLCEKREEQSSAHQKVKRMNRNASAKGFVLLGGERALQLNTGYVVVTVISAADPACACYDLGLTARITSQRERTSRQTGLGNPADWQEVGSWGDRSSQAPPAFGGCELYEGAPSSGGQQLSQHLCVPVS